MIKDEDDDRINQYSYAGEKGFDPPGQVAPQLLLRGSRLQKKGNSTNIYL